MNYKEQIKGTKLVKKAREIKHLLSLIPNLPYLDYGRISYSQFGEDLLVDTALTRLLISQPTYLDIGAHHSRYLSNTFYLYRKGCHGVCVEPNPVLCKEIKEHRDRDICINAGVGFDSAEFADFYVMKNSTLSTFSKDEAEQIERLNPSILKEVVRLPLVSINQIIAQHFDTCPDFISVDVEGLDLDILKSLDFSLYRPVVFCIETINYSLGREIEKRHEIIDFLSEKQYFVYADTSLNSIFVDKRRWLDISTQPS